MVHPQGYTLRVVDATQLYLLLYTFHNDPTAGHVSAKKMLEKLRSRYFWPNMTKDVEQYVQSCYQCQMKQPIRKINELHPIPPSRIFDRWGVDVVGPLPITQQQNRYIVVAVDYLSRWQEAKPLKEATASTIANFLYYEIICRYGCFKHLHTDRGTEFVNEVVQELMERFRVKHHRSTPYRPQANGLVERFNKTLCDSLVKLSEESADWDLLVGPALFAHRTATNRSTQLSPYMIVHGIEPQFPGDQLPRQTLWDHMKNMAEGMPRLRDRAKMAIRRAQEKMKNAYPVQMTKQSFKIGDKVTMYWKPAETQGKFVPRRRGPYDIIGVLGNGTYKLADEKGVLKAPINGDLLKLYKDYSWMEPVVVIDQ